MPRSLPSLNWLLAFECSARHLNFTAAATELNLTQSAVSQQVRLLEARLGTALFNRKARGLALTDSGRRLLPSISGAIECLKEGVAPFDTHGFNADETRQSLKIACSTSFSLLWLAPRLRRFLSVCPDTDVHIINTLWPDDYIASGADIEIRFGSRELVGEGAEVLMMDTIVPICAPDIAKNINCWAELCAIPLVQVVGVSDTWKTYAEDLGLEPPPAGFCLVDSTVLAIEVARYNRCVALAYRTLAEQLILSDDIAIALDLPAFARDNHFIKLNGAPGKSLLEASFRDWIFSEIN